jgi:hypothetical protein
MDATTFDRLTRMAGAAASRRRLVAGVVAAILGGRINSLPRAAFASRVTQVTTSAEAESCKANGETCQSASECCSERCARKGKDGKKVCKSCTVSRCGAKDNVCEGPVCGCKGDENCGCWRRVGGGGTCASILQGACVECASDSTCVKLFGVKGAKCILTEGKNCECPYGHRMRRPLWPDLRCRWAAVRDE